MSSATLHFRLLGPPLLARPGEATPLPLRNERPAQLLAVLAYRGDWMSRDQLAGLLWPDDPQATARQNLRWALHAARGLAGDALQTDRQRVRVIGDSDLRSFDAEREAGRHLEAASHYTGPLLEGLENGASVSFQQWLPGERERVRVRFIDSAVRAAAAALAQQPVLAVNLAERVLAAEPFEDRALAVLIQGLANLGRAAEAKNRYGTYAVQLLAEQQLEPPAAIQQLVRSLDRPAAPAHRAPRPALDTFIGRAEELAQLRALLAQPDCRLITVIGVGGVGKSRFLAEFAATAGRRDLHVVSLESLTLPVQLPGAVAAALRLSPSPGIPVEAQVTRALGAAPALLALDNFEHVIDAAQWLTQWLGACPALKIIVTSRERLGVEDEWLLPIAGLPQRRGNGDAEQLFAARARAMDPSFDAHVHAADIARIARLVDGMPLALELAAATVRLLPCRDIADDIEQTLELLSLPLAGGSGGVSASIERSWSLLTARERDAFVRLAVFAAPFTAAAARAVCDVGGAALVLLRDKSMLQPASGERLRMHPLLRQFAVVRLAEQPALEQDLRERQTQHFASAFDPRASTPTLRINDELPDVLAAWQRSVAARRIDRIAALAPPLADFFGANGRLREGCEIFDQAAAVADGKATQGAASIDAARATLRLRMGEAEAAEKLARQALAGARGGNERRTQLHALLTLGEALRSRGRLRPARAYLVQAHRRASQAGEARAAANGLRLLALIDKQLGQYRDGLAKLALAEDLFRAVDDRPGLLALLNNRGTLHSMLGELDAARAAFEEGLLRSLQWKIDATVPFLHVNLATVAFERDDFTASGEHAAQALAHARGQGIRHIELAALCVLAGVHAMRGAHNEARISLAQAARVPAPFAALSGVAVTYARVLACAGELVRACAVARLVQQDPRSTEPCRVNAGVELARLEGRLAAADHASAEALAQHLTLESVLAEVAAAAP